GKFPHPNGAVQPGRHERLAVRTEADRADPILVATKAAQLVAALRVPHLNERVAAARGNRFPVPAKTHRANWAIVAVVLAHQRRPLAWRNVPQLHEMIAAAGRQPLTVRAISNRADAEHVGREYDGLCLGSQVPQLDRTVGEAGGKLLAVRAEGDR